jgi:hypothetical protein
MAVSHWPSATLLDHYKGTQLADVDEDQAGGDGMIDVEMMRDGHMEKRGRGKVIKKVRAVENVGTEAGKEVRGEVARGDDVGEEERTSSGRMGKIFLDGGERRTPGRR